MITLDPKELNARVIIPAVTHQHHMNRTRSDPDQDLETNKTHSFQKKKHIIPGQTLTRMCSRNLHLSRLESLGTLAEELELRNFSLGTLA